MNKTLEERFWEKVDKTPGHGPNGDCWVWTGARNPKGYGNFSSNKRFFKAHRHAWSLFNGEIPKNIFVCHRCDNPSCVRPEHLFLGSNQDNLHDASLKGRMSSWQRAQGEANGNSRIDRRAVRAIREAFENACFSVKQLADGFNIGRSTVLHILNRETWRHV